MAPARPEVGRRKITPCWELAHVKKIAFALAALAGLFLSSPSFADSRDFDLINATGYAIKAVYMDTTASTTWGYPSEIDSPLQDGQTARITFSKSDGKSCMWDLKVVWADGSADDVWTGINVCTVSTVKLKYNRSTNVTSAEMN